MILYALNYVAAFVIFVWAIWCVLSPNVHDGIFGKLMFAMSAVAAFAVIVGPQLGSRHPIPEVTLNLCMAGLALRHVSLRSLWPRFRNRFAKRSGGVYQRRASDGF